MHRFFSTKKYIHENISVLNQNIISPKRYRSPFGAKWKDKETIICLFPIKFHLKFRTQRWNRYSLFGQETNGKMYRFIDEIITWYLMYITYTYWVHYFTNQKWHNKNKKTTFFQKVDKSNFFPNFLRYAHILVIKFIYV